jgi:IS5 family transposase
MPCSSARQVHARVVAPARDAGVVEGRRLRVDTTVTETDVHYPTDSSLLGDGVRVLTRTMRQVTAIAGAIGATVRDRPRSVTRRLIRRHCRQSHQHRSCVGHTVEDLTVSPPNRRLTPVCTLAASPNQPSRGVNRLANEFCAGK